MTLFKQFADSVTGSNLPKNFQKTRVRLTIFIFLFFTLVLVLSGWNVSETTRMGLENARREAQQEYIQRIRSGQRPDFPLPEIIENFEAGNPPQLPGTRERLRRSQTLQQIQLTIFINNIILLILLTFITWIGLYFLLMPLAKAVQERERFLSQASHELRTPLAILYSELSLSQNEDDIQQLQKVHHQSLTEIRRLQKLSDTLLGRESQEQQVLNVAEVIKEVWISLSPVNSAGFELKLSGELTVKTLQTEFYQLIYNLIENALKHGQATEPIRIKLSSNGKIMIQNATHQTDFISGLGLSSSRELAAKIEAKINYEISRGFFVVIIDIA